jgi:endonuclease YncB( thermonuclease family)
VKHWRPEDEYVPLQPADRRDRTNIDNHGTAGEPPLPHPALVGLALVAAACLGLAFAFYQAVGHRDSFAPSESHAAIPYFGECPTGGGRNCVMSGDTFDMDGTRYRIAGIEAPQLLAARCLAEEREGRASARRLRELLNGGIPRAIPIGTGRRGGVTLAIVSVDGRELGAMLVREGRARPYGAMPEGWC